MAQLLKLKSIFLSILPGLFFPLTVEETLLNADHLLSHHLSPYSCISPSCLQFCNNWGVFF